MGFRKSPMKFQSQISSWHHPHIPYHRTRRSCVAKRGNLGLRSSVFIPAPKQTPIATTSQAEKQNAGTLRMLVHLALVQRQRAHILHAAADAPASLRAGSTRVPMASRWFGNMPGASSICKAASRVRGDMTAHC